MKFKVGDTVVLKVNGKRYKIVGDSKTPVSDLFFGPKYPENTKDFFIKEDTEIYSHPIQVEEKDLSNLE